MTNWARRSFIQSDSWPLAPGQTGPEAVRCPFFPFIKPSQQWSRCLSWNSACFYHSVFRIQYCLLRGLIRRKQEIGQLKMIPNHVLKIRHCWGYPGSLAFFRCTQIAVSISEGFMHMDIPGGCSPRPPLSLEWTWGPTLRITAAASRGLPLDPVSAELIFPVASPPWSCHHPFTVRPACWQLAALQAQVGLGPWGGAEPLLPGAPPVSSIRLFKMHKRFFFPVLLLYKQGVFRSSQGRIFYKR